MSEPYLIASANPQNINGERAALVLQDIADTVRKESDGKRHDLKIEVHQHE